MQTKAGRFKVPVGIPRGWESDPEEGAAAARPLLLRGPEAFPCTQLSAQLCNFVVSLETKTIMFLTKDGLMV